MPAFLEERYRRKHLNCVRHITLDPKGHGVVRIHMIPPRQDAADAPFLLLLNGDKLVPLNFILGHSAGQLHGPAGTLCRSGDQ